MYCIDLLMSFTYNDSICPFGQFSNNGRKPKRKGGVPFGGE